ncbi:MAG: histidine kinase [Salinibacterium sp.]|nr:histidine kinase [Salinibacterium sp.]
MVDSATTVRSVPQGKQPRNPISRKQVETVISRSVAVFGIVFGAQTIPWLLGQLDEAYPAWLWIVVPASFGSLVVALVLSFTQVWVRQSHGLFAIVFLVALISWPFAVIPGVAVYPGIHWLDYILTVATAMAAIAFSARVGTIYLFVACVIYGVIRITPWGGGAPWLLAVVESVYAIILGAAIMIIVTMLRQAATKVDNAQAMALDRYGRAVRQHAMEVERVQVDSIVHDSVLTTFISASRAYTPEARALAATMAGNAIGHLKDAAATSPDDGTMMRLSALASKITDSAARLSEPFEIRTRRTGSRSIPSQAADAVHSAAVQAMMNSLQHAGSGAVSRWLTVRGFGTDGIEVIVGDTGRGFLVSDVPGERLGVRISIIERVANAGGLAVIQSAPQQGTSVTIRWPSESVRAPAVLDDVAEAGGVAR